MQYSIYQFYVYIACAVAMWILSVIATLGALWYGTKALFQYIKTVI